jgi:hypothetical protein
MATMSEFHPVGHRVARSFAEADVRDALPHVQVPTLSSTATPRSALLCS